MLQAEELKTIRIKAAWTQSQMAKALGVTPNYLAMMERGEKPIEPRTELLIDALARKRIDVSFSDALGKWVVAITKPSINFGGREHHLIAAKASKNEAQKIAQELCEADDNVPMLIIRERAP